MDGALSKQDNRPGNKQKNKQSEWPAYNRGEGEKIGRG